MLLLGRWRFGWRTARGRELLALSGCVMLLLLGRRRFS